MLRSHYSHRQNRKYVSAFGSLFNEITLVRYNSTRTAELERIKVPIVYGPKEKWLTRITADPSLNKNIQITLPTMSFEIVGISYDPTRKQNAIIKLPKANNSTYVDSQLMGVPYDINFELTIFARNIDDGDQIVEQILPTFTPDYVLSMVIIPEMGYVKDIPVVLNSVNQNIEYEGEFESTRLIMWTLQFTMKAYYFGPVTPRKIIKRAYANTFLDPSIQSGSIVRVNLTNGNNGTFKIDDIAFQGPRLEEATAAGIVLKFDSVNNTLRIGGAQGTFRTSEVIRAAETNAAYTLQSFDATPLKLVAYKVEVDPFTAEPGDDYGYSDSVKEFPDTLDS